LDEFLQGRAIERPNRSAAIGGYPQAHDRFLNHELALWSRLPFLVRQELPAHGDHQPWGGKTSRGVTSSLHCFSPAAQSRTLRAISTNTSSSLLRVLLRVRNPWSAVSCR